MFGETVGFALDGLLTDGLLVGFVSTFVVLLVIGFWVGLKFEVGLVAGGRGLALVVPVTVVVIF